MGKWSMALVVLMAMGVFACDAGDGEAGRDTLSGEDDAITECVALCEYALADDVDLSEGPCMSEEVIEDWACDIVHDPRTDTDDLDTNQCADYEDDIVPYIVELTPDCVVLGTR